MTYDKAVDMGAGYLLVCLMSVVCATMLRRYLKLPDEPRYKPDADRPWPTIERDQELIEFRDGPMDGRCMSWRGGDYVSFEEQEPVKVLGGPPQLSRPKRPHTYKRRAEEPRFFDYVGRQ